MDVAAGFAADLAAELADASSGRAVTDASDAQLVDLVLGWQQLAGVVLAEQSRLVRELSVRNDNRPTALVAELAAALSWTTMSTQNLVGRAHELGELTVVDDALRSGTLDVRRVDVLLDELGTLGVGTDALPDAASVQDARARVAAAVVAQGDTMTSTQLRRLARREVIAVDTAATRRRTERAVASRRVTVDWAPDGMAWVSAFLPAPDAMLIRTVLDAASDAAASNALDDRTADQRRADILTSIFASIAQTGVLPCGDALASRQRTRPHIQVTVAATTLLGLDDAPADLAGYGPIPADVARAIAADGTWRRILTDPVTGTLLERGSRTYRPGAQLAGHVIARDVTCTFPGCVRPAGSAELDHIAPFRHGEDASGAAQTTAENLHAACKRHHDLKTEGVWSVARTQGGGVAWTSRAGITYAVHPEPILAEPITWHHGPPDDRGPADTGPPPF